MSDTGFEVMEEVQLPDLTDVKEDQVVVPTASGVLMLVNKVSGRQLKDETAEQYGQVKSLSIELRIVDGIEVPKKNEQGQIIGTEMKYKNKPMFLDLPYWADTTHPNRQAEKYTGKNLAYLNPIKQFLLALGMDITSIKVGDGLCQQLQGRQLRASITQREIRSKTAEGEWIGTGEYKNELKQFKPA